LDPEDVVTVEDVKARLDRGDPLCLLDVREPHEYAICRIGNAQLVPQHELPARLHEVARDAEIVVYCREGGRSAQAVQLLKRAGYQRVRNMSGGILAWAERVDPSMPTN
jgi:adenylyltransferase/sulfurtransferase